MMQYQTRKFGYENMLPDPFVRMAMKKVRVPAPEQRALNDTTYGAIVSRERPFQRSPADRAAEEGICDARWVGP
jgi:hypothetical protein